LLHPIESPERLQNIVRVAFTKQHKTLRNALPGVVAPEALEDLKFEI
jgi:16S rRNA A1518/A1519 N6-dimethyltransferase RsmA/KsgA/DIM1 with predicted DNA glycosylase/AP lyase activity